MQKLINIYNKNKVFRNLKNLGNFEFYIYCTGRCHICTKTLLHDDNFAQVDIFYLYYFSINFYSLFILFLLSLLPLTLVTFFFFLFFNEFIFY